MNDIDKTKEYITKAISIHGDKYDYSKVEYKNSQTNVCIICKEHGEFWQRANTHLSGKGCPKCGRKMIKSKKLSNTSEFIKKAIEIHGNKYDYSKVEYINTQTKICIICPIHGEFLQTPNGHLSGSGCYQCYLNKNTSNTSKFIARAKEVHGDKYDYSKIKYITSLDKVTIICPIHGEFEQRASHHLSGKCCPECVKIAISDKNSYNTSTFIKKAIKIHGNKYDYSKVKYINAISKIWIICPLHGEFWQKPNDHLNGNGCKECGIILRVLTQCSNTSSFIEKAKEVHGDKYDYSKVNYTNATTKVCIICPIHGEFYQTPTNHLSGKGCKECGIITTKNKLSSNNCSFIESVKEIHGDKYDYSKVEYIGSKHKICIICPIHGEFWQEASSHLRGNGCQKCACINSKAEEEVSNYIQSLGIETIRGNRKILNGLELDMLIPSKNVAIEYNGLRWHSEEFGKDKYYHLNKTLDCKKQGVNLIHIFEDEYLEHKEVVLNKIKHILGISEELPKIMGRKCKVEEVDTKTAMNFLTEYHIQGYGSSTLHLGAVYCNELVAVMSFKKEGKESLKWELTRFASNIHYVCQGIGGKLFKHFIKNYSPQEVKSFADRRWTLNEESNLYTKLGFELDGILPPEYRYVVGKERKHKFGFRKQILHKKYGLSLDMTEKEMTAALGFPRIWDCGLLKYIWKNKESK